jgi:hypothetical protein
LTCPEFFAPAGARIDEYARVRPAIRVAGPKPKRLAQQLNDPGSCGMASDVEVHDAAAIIAARRICLV